MTWNSEQIDALWDFRDPAGSEARFREALANGAGEEARTQIARSLGLQRRFEEASAELDAIQEPGSSLLLARIALERGRILNSSGHPAESIPYFEEALSYADDDFYTVDAAHMLAIVSPGEASLDWNLRAIEMAKGSHSPRAQGWLGSLANNTAWSLHDLGRLDEALEMFQVAEAHWAARQNDEKPADHAERYRIAKWAVARCLRSLGRYEEALAIQLTLGEDGYVFEELGENYLALGRADEAGPAFREAHKLLSQDSWLAENEPQRLARMAELAGGSA